MAPSFALCPERHDLELDLALNCAKSSKPANNINTEAKPSRLDKYPRPLHVANEPRGLRLTPHRLYSRVGPWLFRRPNRRPIPGSGSEFVPQLRPVVQRRWVEVGTVWPRERTDFGIQGGSIENRNVLQGSEDRTFKYRTKVNSLLGPVLECHGEREWRHNVEPHDAMNRMGHPYLNGSILTGG